MTDSTYMKKFFVMLFLILAGMCEAQNPQWVVDTTQNSGLHASGIGAIAVEHISSKNIIWVGTSKGLTKFDGINWITYDTYISPVRPYV